MNPISRTATLIITSICCLMTTACTTIKPVYDDSQASIASQLKPGDRVRITLINDRSKEITITAVDETAIKGTTYKASTTQRKGAPVEEEWVDVYSVETVKISPIKTAGAAVGITAAVPLLAVGLLLGGGF